MNADGLEPMLENVDVLRHGSKVRVRLNKPKLYEIDGRTFMVPRGFITDFASVPRGLWNTLPPWGEYAEAAVLHDWLYRNPGIVTRKEADLIFRKLMKQHGVGFLKRWVMWAGLRVGGGRAYRKAR